MLSARAASCYKFLPHTAVAALTMVLDLRYLFEPGPESLVGQTGGGSTSQAGLNGMVQTVEFLLSWCVL